MQTMDRTGLHVHAARRCDGLRRGQKVGFRVRVNYTLGGLIGKGYTVSSQIVQALTGRSRCSSM